MPQVDIDTSIHDTDNIICKNIDMFHSHQPDRGLISQNILGHLRNLVEHIAVKIANSTINATIDYQGIKSALRYIKGFNKYAFLSHFHNCLQESKSHYTPNDEGAERLMMKYHPYLVMIKNFAKKEFNMDLLKNIHKFPTNEDKTIAIFHKAIVGRINHLDFSKNSFRKERMYIYKISPFVVDNEVYYEMVLTPAYDKTSKFDHFIVYTDAFINTHYAIEATFYNDSITLDGKIMPIYILREQAVSIRPCEIKNFSLIFNQEVNLTSLSSEYIGLKNYLNNTSKSLLDIVLSPEKDYQETKNKIYEKCTVRHFENVLDSARRIILRNSHGSNVIRYLLHTMHNKTIKLQTSDEKNYNLSNLKLKPGCIPFDEMPFATSLIKHNPESSILFECIEYKNRDHEIMDRYIHSNMVEKSRIYFPQKELGAYSVESNIESFNKKVYSSHEGRRLEKFGNNIYINEAFTSTKEIIEKIKTKTETGLNGYSNAINEWLSTHSIDSPEKEYIIKTIYCQSHVAIIYGAAGTGKTYLVNLLSQFFDSCSKLYLANTNPAIENLRRKVNAKNCTFMTIFQFISRRNVATNHEILIMDECSMVSNSDMVKVLKKVNCKLMLLVGDTCQIKPIDFGNWFNIVKSFIPKYAWHELTDTYRTKDKDLLIFWKKVRELKPDLTECIVANRYATRLGLSVFDKKADDEIILCLNYDGLYGINNINRFLQENNKNKPVRWGIWTYKVGDPILFNESERFAPLLYNNLKGTIVDIDKQSEEKIWFTLEIDKAITELDLPSPDLKLLKERTPGKSVIKFPVIKKDSSDNDETYRSDATEVPFQIAYAVSIHKAQGLEYDSVKIIITEEVDQMITHDIFYTAITRSKEHLTIYWSPETQQKVLKNLNKNDFARDVSIFSAHSGLNTFKIK